MEGKGGVKDDTQVAGFRRWGDGAAVDLEDEVTNLLVQGLVCHKHELCFIAVQLKVVGRHPCFDVMQVVDEGLRGELGGWSGAEIQLGIISVTVEIESMMSDDLAEGEHVNGEQEGAKHRALGYTVVDWGRG